MIRTNLLILSAITAMFLLLTCNSNKKSGAIIKGNIENIKDSEILVSYLLSDSLIVDTAYCDSQGKFSYTCNIDTLTSLSLYFNNQSASVLVFANPNDKISLKGDINVSDLIKIYGNEINDDLSEFKEINKDLLTRRNLLYNNLHTDIVNGDTVSSEIARSDEGDLLIINAINIELLIAAEDFIEKHPERLSSLILINEFFANSNSSNSFERVMGLVKGDVLKTQLGLNLSTYLQKIKQSAEKERMPYFQIIDIKGDTIRSNDLKNKYLLLSFVSSNSSQSDEITERLKGVYKNLKKDSVEFISIYIDPITISKDQFIPPVDSIDWKVVLEERSWASDIVDAFNIEFIPNNILISPEGIIMNRNISTSEIENRINTSDKRNNN